MLANFKNKLNMPIYRDDLFNTLIQGVISAILIGFLFGMVDGFLNTLGFPLSVGMVILGFLMGKRVSKCYRNFHIIYPILAIVFVLIAFYFYRIGGYFAISKDIEFAFSLILKKSFYLNMISSFYNGFLNLNISKIIFQILYIVFFGVMIYFAYHYAKRKF